MTEDIHSSIEGLKQHMIFLGTVVEESVTTAIKSVRSLDNELAVQVLNGDKKINSLEVDVEELCLKILALHQPVASDLRFVITVLKMNTDFERIGDLACKIADKVVLVNGTKRLLDSSLALIMPSKFDVMFDTTQTMFSSCLDAFVREDSDLAHKVCVMDDVVDNAKRAIRVELEEISKNQPELQPYLPMILSVARGLERISDHATHISEDIIYMLQGRIIRHEKTI
ncbi:MAG: phosphate signaling complex protein PhoU [Bacteroidales bacterium]|nr:phosphate signaling complex protein PhoU [Bacteroidales bacterium]